jgi:outer membrane protein assembly factor BamB
MVLCCGAYKLTPEKAELLWKMPGGGIADETQSPVVYEDHLYWLRNFYDGPVWHCVDMKTGAVKWTEQKPPIPSDCNCSSPVLADGKIILPIGLGHAALANGTPYQVEMLKATPEKFLQLGAFEPKVAPMSSPAVAGGRLYLRLVDGVACYDLTAAGNQ